MRHGSLFSGIGGFDLAAEWMGWENKFHCEWNPFGQKILKHYWPESESYGDITTTDFTIWNGKLDIVTGGFPCQPYSQAGKRLGKEDERHLWPEMLRAIREIQPRWVVGENVFGLINWNDGMVFDEVQADLEAEGYEVQPYVLPAVAVNAPHRRDRIWFVAYRDIGTKRTPGASGCAKSNGGKNDDEQKGGRTAGQLGIGCSAVLRHSTNPKSNGLNQRNGKHEVEPSEGRIDALGNIGSGDINGDNANATGKGWGERLGQEADIEGWEVAESGQERCGLRFDLRAGYSTNRVRTDEWDNFPTQSPVCGGDDGLPAELDGITFSKWRNQSIKAYGNAIVPQVAHQIFRSIDAYEKIILQKA